MEATNLLKKDGAVRKSIDMADDRNETSMHVIDVAAKCL